MEYPVLVFYADGGMIYAKNDEDASQATFRSLRLHGFEGTTIVGVNGIMRKASTAHRVPRNLRLMDEST